MIAIDLKKHSSAVKSPLNVTVSNIQVANHQIVITGTNLQNVSKFNIKDGAATTELEIESKTATSIVANTLSNVTFAAGKMLDFIFTSAEAASTFTVNFSLCDSTLGGKGFNCSITPNDKEVLSYDAVSGKWKPRSVNGLTYMGAWDALNDSPAGPPVTHAGEYYIVSVADAPYQVGDWVVYNGTTFDRIDNSQSITNVFGRTGAVSAQEGDYDLTKLSDVTITGPTTNQVLKYNGTAWVNASESDPSVTAFAKAALPTCGAGEVLKANGTSLSCVTDNAGTSFTGTANRAVVTDGSGNLSVSTITTTLLGHLSGVTSNIQTQLDAKLSSYTETDPGVSAFAKAALPTCNAGEVLKANGTSLSCVTDNSGSPAYTGTQNRVVLTDGATGALTTSSVTNTELGYVSGVTSAIQTQLDAKQATITAATAVTAGSVETNLQAGIMVKPYGTNAGETGPTRFYELAANGSNYTGFKSPDILGANLIYTLPATAPNAGEVLSSNASGVLSWTAIPSAPVSSVNGATGAVTLTTTNIAEGTNLYFTNARVLGLALTGFATDTNAIAATDTILQAMGKAQGQINNKLNSSSFIQWDASGVQTIDPSRLSLGAGNASKAIVTDASGFVKASSVTATELGYLSGVTSSIQTQLNAKLSSYTETDPGVSAFAKAALPTCNAGEVLKGNGTSLSCVTDNSGSPAYTGTQNRVVLTDGATGALTTSSVTNTELGYVSGVTSAIQTQLDAKQATITAATAVTAGSVETNLQAGIMVKPYGTNAGETGPVRFYELAANGSNYTGFKSPDILGANLIYTLPATAPNAGEVLSSNASGVLSWTAIPSAPVSSVNGATGVVTLTTTNIAEGTNLYFTNARVLGLALTGFATDTNAIAATDTILQAMGKAQGQINNKLNSSSFIQWDASGVQTIDPSRLSLGAGNASKAMVTDASGFVKASSVTATELGYLSGVTSAIQTQLGNKQGTLTNSAGLAGALSDESGTGLAVFNSAPTLTNPVIANLAPSGNFTLTQNSVAVLTSESVGALVNTLYMKAGKVGIGVNAPAAKLDVDGEVKFGNTSSTCNSTNEGQQRYNSTTKTMQYCNGSAWASFGSTVAGTVTLSTANNCNWTTTSSSWTSFSADSDCNSAATTGAATSPGKYPGITFSSLTPGTYRVKLQGYFGPSDSASGIWSGADTACDFRLYDGSNGGPMIRLDTIDGQDRGTYIEALFTYSSAQSNITFTFQAMRAKSSGTCAVSADTNNGSNGYRMADLFMTVERVGD